MQELVNSIGDPKIAALAFIGGIIPAFFWLIFWLREDKERKESIPLVAITFIAGMLSVIVILPVEKYFNGLGLKKELLTVIWASSEELIKFVVFILIMYKSSQIDSPVRYPIYLMTVALGFASLENSFYLLKPITANNATLSILTGNLRFLGSTLLHAAASGIVGISIGLSFFKGRWNKILYAILGLFAAIALHSTFNFFIMEHSGENFLQVFGFLWVITIIIMLLFEKLRRMGAYVSSFRAQ